MHRFVLTDVQWAKMEPLCLGKPTDPGRSGSDNRMFLEAVLWIARTGSPWRICRRRSATGIRCSSAIAIG
jgi:transposase